MFSPENLREMAGERGKWVVMVTAQTPTNIAVIKYWGKRDENLILPVNDSISVTLDPDHLCTITTVAVSPAFDRDRMWLNGKVNRLNCVWLMREWSGSRIRGERFVLFDVMDNIVFL